MTKEDGTEAEEDVYEAYNLSLFLKGQKSQIPEGVGVRLNNEKFMVLNTLKAPTYVAKIKDADGNETPYNVTIDEVHLMRKGQITVFIGVKGGYFCAVFADAKVPAQTGPAASAALAIGFYYLVGPDA